MTTRIADLPSRAEFYSKLLPAIRDIAREHGYAIGVHGSQRRDFDLIAVPWIEAVSTPETLVHGIAKAAGGIIKPLNNDGEPWPRKRAWGRLCWSIHLDGGLYLDISVVSPLTFI